MKLLREYSPYLLLLVFASAVTVFFSHLSGLLAFHEMYQFFLFTTTYFIERLSVAGGIADYLSEFIVQFFYDPLLGAALVAMLLSGMSALLYTIIKTRGEEWSARLLKMGIAITPAIFVIIFMSDENMMLTFPVALTLALSVVQFLRHATRDILHFVIATIIAIPLLYWIVGPVAIIPVIISVLTSDKLEKRVLYILGSILYFVLTIIVLGRLFMIQYPNASLFLGVDYYRQPTQFPCQLYLIPLYTILVAQSGVLLRLVKGTIKILYTAIVVIGIIVLSITSIKKAYESDKYTTMQYISMSRQELWHDIIELSQKENPKNELSKQCVMLALAKCGQLGEKMFKYDLQRVEDLFDTFKMNSVSATPSAEAAYHLALVNTCFRYYFDSQEAIPNSKKSAHMTKRMAECMMVNGKYNVAKKYIERLKHTIHYSDWAYDASNMLSDEKINIHPILGEMRRLRFKTENFFFYPQLDTELGLLAIESEGRNRLAWDYFCAAMLLKGDLQKFVGMYHYASEIFHQREIPVHFQEAILLFWSFGHANTDGLPYPVSQDVVARLTHFINKIKQNPNYWKNISASYWTYFMSQQQKQQKHDIPAQSPQQGGNEREG